MSDSKSEITALFCRGWALPRLPQVGKFEIHRPRRGKFAPYELFRVLGHERFQKEGTLGAAQLFVKSCLFRLVADIITVNFEGARLAAEPCRLLFEESSSFASSSHSPFRRA